MDNNMLLKEFSISDLNIGGRHLIQTLVFMSHRNETTTFKINLGEGYSLSMKISHAKDDSKTTSRFSFTPEIIDGQHQSHIKIINMEQENSLMKIWTAEPYGLMNILGANNQILGRISFDILVEKLPPSAWKYIMTIYEERFAGVLPNA